MRLLPAHMLAPHVYSQRPGEGVVHSGLSCRVGAENQNQVLCNSSQWPDSCLLILFVFFNTLAWKTVSSGSTYSDIQAV